MDFLPLTVDYRENTYAAGKIPGGFFKREGRPNEKEILTSRMIDRPLRPLFPEGYAARPRSSACCSPPTWRTTPTPWPSSGPPPRSTSPTSRSTAPSAPCASATGTGSSWSTRPRPSCATKSKLNLLVAGTEDAIVMVEAGASEITEAVMVQALATGHAVIKQIVAMQKELRKRAGKPKRTVVEEGARPGFAA